MHDGLALKSTTHSVPSGAEAWRSAAAGPACSAAAGEGSSCMAARKRTRGACATLAAAQSLQGCSRGRRGPGPSRTNHPSSILLYMACGMMCDLYGACQGGRVKAAVAEMHGGCAVCVHVRGDRAHRLAPVGVARTALGLTAGRAQGPQTPARLGCCPSAPARGRAATAPATPADSKQRQHSQRTHNAWHGCVAARCTAGSQHAGMLPVRASARICSWWSTCIFHTLTG